MTIDLIYEKLKPITTSRYFTKEFLSNYLLDAEEAEIRIVAEGKLDHSNKDVFKLTKTSDFYSKDGGAYCQFLSDINDIFHKYRIDIIDGYKGLIRRLYYKCADEEAAERLAHRLCMILDNARTFDIDRVS